MIKEAIEKNDNGKKRRYTRAVYRAISQDISAGNINAAYMYACRGASIWGIQEYFAIDYLCTSGLFNLSLLLYVRSTEDNHKG